MELNTLMGNKRYIVKKIENFLYNGKTYELPKGVWVYYDSVNAASACNGYNAETRKVLKQMLEELKDGYSEDESVQAIRDWLDEV